MFATSLPAFATPWATRSRSSVPSYGTRGTSSTLAHLTRSAPTGDGGPVVADHEPTQPRRPTLEAQPSPRPTSHGCPPRGEQRKPQRLGRRGPRVRRPPSHAGAERSDRAVQRAVAMGRPARG